MKTGVYKITCHATGRSYIGSCAYAKGGIQHRWQKHQTDLNLNRHHSIKFQRAWNKYGADAFIFEILLYCAPQDCLMYEQIALDHYKSEYNICSKAGNTLGYRHTKETKLRIGNANHGRKHSEQSKKKMSSTRLQRGSKRGENNSSAKLADGDIREIRRRLEVGSTLAGLAQIFGVSISTISDIKHKRTWSHII